MSLWRREAIERFPELHREISDAEGIDMMWFVLRKEMLEPAYQKNQTDLKTVARVYDYAQWSLKNRGMNVRTGVVLGFYESLPHDNRIWRDMPRWLSQEDFDMLQFAWEYSTKQPFDDLRREFVANKARIDKERANH